MMTVQKIALTITIIGAIVWGIFGIFDANILTMIFGDGSIMPRIIYIIVGFCGIINLGLLFADFDEK